MSKRLLIVAGEASGDLHGARLLSELRGRVSDLSVYGLGGEAMSAQGVEMVADVSTISVMGLAEVARVLPKARGIFKKVVARVEAEPPDLAVLIDFPEFNLRLAPALRRLGVPVAYYVSPQVWAWRKGRINSMSRCIDKMLVFFPFEVDFYRGRLDVVHVGHPLVDEVPILPQAWDCDTDPEPLRLVIMPGSRTSEVRRLLPVLLDSAAALQRVHPGMEATLVQASTVADAAVDSLIETSDLEVRRVREEGRYGAIAAAHLALCASGTATLEVGLLGTPMIVIYRIGFFSYLLGRSIVDVPFISLVNLVLGRAVVPELIQSEARVERIRAEAEELLHNPKRRDAMRAGLNDLRRVLGEPGASGRAAAEVAEMLGESGR